MSKIIDLELFKKIDELLWEQWDPLGVYGTDARGAYYAYIPEVYELVRSRASVNAITYYFLGIEKDTMGLRAKGRKEKCTEVAKTLLSYLEKR